MQRKVSDRKLLKIIIEIYVKSNRSGTKKILMQNGYKVKNLSGAI